MSRYLSNYTGPQVDAAIGQHVSGIVAMPLGVPDPEGSIQANPNTLAYGSDGSLWYKYSGTSDTGWTKIVLDSNLDIIGGDF